MAVSRNGRRAGISKPRRFAAKTPISAAAMMPVAGLSASQPAAIPATAASTAAVLSCWPSATFRTSSHSTSVPAIPPTSPVPTQLSSSSARLPAPARLLAITPCRTITQTIAASGPSRAVSQIRACRSRCAGRTKARIGATTVRPAGTRIAPIMIALPASSPSSPAAVATSAIVTGSPTRTSRSTIRRVCPVSSRRFRCRPALNSRIAMASDSIGW